MTTLQRPIVGFRFIEIRRGDTLQSIAGRELGDAARWVDLLAYNALVPPYITDDPTQVGTGVLLSGALIRVPAASVSVSAATDPTQVFGTDVGLDANGNVMLSNGDFGTLSGIDNLGQALRNRVVTELGELIYHQDYGSLVPRLVGRVDGPVAELLAAQYARAAVLSDPRIDRVTQSSAVVAGDSIQVSVEAVPIVGQTIQLVV